MRKLLEPLRVGNMELRNRVILSAMAKYFCTNGFIGQEYIEYYRTIAHGGTALITPGIMCVEPKWYGQHEQPFLNDDKYIPGLKAAIDAVHGEGAKFSCQLWMPGHLPYTQADYIETNGPKLVAVNYMSREMIQEMQQKYVDAAIRCAKAGTDAIEWHMAHNYLPEQFYSPYFNHRTDEYGAQNVDNAMRFSLEIIDRIKKACPDVEVVAKMNGTDCHDGEASMAWLGSAASLLEQHGVSLITVNGGGVMSRLTGMSADGNWEDFEKTGEEAAASRGPAHATPTATRGDEPYARASRTFPPRSATAPPDPSAPGYVDPDPAARRSRTAQRSPPAFG